MEKICRNFVKPLPDIFSPHSNNSPWCHQNHLCKPQFEPCHVRAPHLSQDKTPDTLASELSLYMLLHPTLHRPLSAPCISIVLHTLIPLARKFHILSISHPFSTWRNPTYSWRLPQTSAPLWTLPDTLPPPTYSPPQELVFLTQCWLAKWTPIPSPTNISIRVCTKNSTFRLSNLRGAS